MFGNKIRVSLHARDALQLFLSHRRIKSPLQFRIDFALRALVGKASRVDGDATKEPAVN
jgi:hypothetical protein